MRVKLYGRVGHGRCGTPENLGYLGRSPQEFLVHIKLKGGFSLVKRAWATSYENARRYAIRQARREGYDVET